MIRLEDLSKSFGGQKAVDGITLDIPPGKITVFAGADGAGKSTLFKMILGLVHPDRGRIFLKGEDINGQYERITSITGYMPERFSLYPDLSVEENLNFYADIHQVPKKRREELKARLLEKTGMKPFVRRRARALSGGMKQKLALSSILLSAPELIILDEPTTGVDPLSRIEFFHIIDDLKNEGKTILLSTPYLDEAEKGDLVVFMSEGRIFHTDQIDSLRSSFPARIFRLTPRDSVFDLMERLRKDDRFHGDLYLQGRSVVCLREKGEDVPDIQDVDIEEQAPRLEDMFLYYARRGMEKVE
ncbi:MAG: ABC transporter ATP-binding protein [Acidobacteria bacterium]|nr:ABC transporter ATP-binding protein [Acidobacteriota bacterium]MBU1475006.1 ABC transporter ATP-binding protein [Acidobacteriota bacterium]